MEGKTSPWRYSGKVVQTAFIYSFRRIRVGCRGAVRAVRRFQMGKATGHLQLKKSIVVLCSFMPFSRFHITNKCDRFLCCWFWPPSRASSFESPPRRCLHWLVLLFQSICPFNAAPPSGLVCILACNRTQVCEKHRCADRLLKQRYAGGRGQRFKRP
jgi:hypothetical protein